MSYDSVEISQFDAKPREFFKLDTGTTIYRYAAGTRSETLATGDTEVDGDYIAHPISIGELEHTRDSKSLEVPIVVPRDNPIAQLFRLTLPDAKISITVFRKHASDTEVISWFSGTIKSCDFRESQAVFTCQPTLGAMSKEGLRWRYQIQCNLPLYSTRCGVNPDDFKSTVTVSDVDALDITVTGMPVVADGYYNGGYMQLADGSKRFIVSHEADVLTILMPFESLTASTSVDIFAGDDYTHTTCRERFNNIANFLGFFTTPGRNPWQQGGLTRAGASVANGDSRGGSGFTS